MTRRYGSFAGKTFASTIVTPDPAVIPIVTPAPTLQWKVNPDPAVIVLVAPMPCVAHSAGNIEHKIHVNDSCVVIETAADLSAYTEVYVVFEYTRQ